MIGRIVLDRYQVDRFLAAGGMSRVYVARQLDADREVVVKFLDPSKVARPEYRDLLHREMAFLARFRHPFAVTLFDADLDDAEAPCLVMEYVRGCTLAGLLERHGRLDPARVGRLLGQLCSVLQTTHARGLIYRDLKPENIMVAEPDTPGETIKVLDLGLAKLAAGARYFAVAEFTGRGRNLSGTPEYLCPEEIRGTPMDHRGDLYSIGVLLFELLTGKRPFDRETIPAMLEAHVYARPPAFAAFGAGDVPQPIQAVVYACLEKDPAARPQSARELAQWYERALGRPITVAEVELPAEETAIDTPSLPQERDRYAAEYRLTAWMPERVAVMKIRGCLPDIGGTVVDSAPGVIRIRLQRLAREAPPPPPSRGGFLSWLGLGEEPPPPPAPEAIDLELFLESADAAQPAKLRITVRLHPPGGAVEADDPEWRAFCDEVLRDLSAYLMARREEPVGLPGTCEL
jgi:serine/threonine-protein kinase